MSDVRPRRKPSLSASSTATSETSGRSSPSRSRFTPTSVVLAEAQLADDLDPLERVDLGVQVTRLDAGLQHVVRQVLRHLLRQRRDEHALARLLTAADLVEEIVDLVLRRAPGRPRGRRSPSAGSAAPTRVTSCGLERPRRRGDEHELVPAVEELVEAQRSVVERRRSRRASASGNGRPRTSRRAAGPSGAISSTKITMSFE